MKARQILFIGDENKFRHAYDVKEIINVFHERHRREKNVRIWN